MCLYEERGVVQPSQNITTRRNSGSGSPAPRDGALDFFLVRAASSCAGMVSNLILFNVVW